MTPMHYTLRRKIAFAATSVVFALTIGGCASAPDSDGPASSANAFADVWDFYNAHAETDRSSLTEDQQGILAIIDMRQEVASGGFDAYFRYWGGNTAEDALSALQTHLGEEWADALNESMSAFGSPYPVEPDAREQFLEDAAIQDRLSALDERVYALEAAVDADARLREALAYLEP
jgi:hypothetical protein